MSTYVVFGTAHGTCRSNELRCNMSKKRHSSWISVLSSMLFSYQRPSCKRPLSKEVYLAPMYIMRVDPYCSSCSETTLTGESRFHISTPQGIWTWVPCDGKLTDSPLDQWDMVRMEWDCRLSTGLPPQQPTPSVVKPEGRPAASVKPGQESCVRSSEIITLTARGPSDGSGGGPPQTRPQWWSITSESPM